jgi:hypothetical protein
MIIFPGFLVSSGKKVSIQRKSPGPMPGGNLPSTHGEEPVVFTGQGPGS